MYKSEKEHPGYRVFHEVYDVFIPKLYCRTQKEMEVFGTYTTGDRTYDQELEHENVRTVRTVYQLAKIQQLGGRIELCRPADSITMYNLIMEYARVWTASVQQIGLVSNLEQYMQTEDYIQQAADMELLTEFAGVLRPHAETRLPTALDVNSAMGKFKLLQHRLGKVENVATQKNVLPADAPTPLNSPVQQRIERRKRMW